MQQLLETYSISEILIFIVILASSIKGVVSFIEWAKDKITHSVREKDKPDRILKKTVRKRYRDAKSRQ